MNVQGTKLFQLFPFKTLNLLILKHVNKSICEPDDNLTVSNSNYEVEFKLWVGEEKKKQSDSDKNVWFRV